MLRRRRSFSRLVTYDPTIIPHTKYTIDNVFSSLGNHCPYSFIHVISICFATIQDFSYSYVPSRRYRIRERRLIHQLSYALDPRADQNLIFFVEVLVPYIEAESISGCLDWNIESVMRSWFLAQHHSQLGSLKPSASRLTPA